MTGGEDHRELHSAAYFGPERDFWWNRDHLELIGSRRRLHEVSSVLDVGSGVGHWGRLLLPLLAPDASLIGIEREAEWVRHATEQAERYHVADRCRYQQGVAESLPFEDGSFDLVTCQTVLIHLPDPQAVIREMLRVTRPGGQLIVSEPNNRVTYLVDSSVTAGADVDDVVDPVRFYLTCERGKLALGEGNSSLGDLLLGLFAQEGLVDVDAYMSDKPVLLFPPFASEAQQALKAYTLEERRRGDWGWSREEANRYFIAGGGTETEFDVAWARRMNESNAVADAVEAGTFHSAGGVILYLVAGRRSL